MHPVIKGVGRKVDDRICGDYRRQRLRAGHLRAQNEAQQKEKNIFINPPPCPGKQTRQNKNQCRRQNKSNIRPRQHPGKIARPHHRPGCFHKIQRQAGVQLQQQLIMRAFNERQQQKQHHHKHRFAGLKKNIGRQPRHSPACPDFQTQVAKPQQTDKSEITESRLQKFADRHRRRLKPGNFRSLRIDGCAQFNPVNHDHRHRSRDECAPDGFALCRRAKSIDGAGQ